MFQEPGDGSMASFMKCYGALFLYSHNFGFLFQTANNAVYSIQEILFPYSALLMTGSNQSCFVTYIGNVSTTESWSLTCQQIRIYSVIQFQRLEVYFKYSFTFVQVRQVNMNLSVETSSTQQSLVQNISTVCCSQHDDTTIGTETIHFGE